ncbi:rhomboid family intramembrane serine protease [Flagellimonas amoyensis]|uniref:rhomboid family intramembrane serine protease n=1 Tax=Flagellimonas amoyensis TaxID=2169401 RepID=UPI000D394429|nr:rhomboid family intramembrane serine protease [Allomuricauda amoyensis]
MELSKPYKFSQSVVLAPLLAVLAIWTVFWAEVRFGINLNEYGIYPRTVSGLKGVVLGPFIHGSVEHLYNNTVPLAVLSSFLFYFYRETAFRVLLLGVVLSGLITWLIGRPSYHIGASGLIYVLSSFIFFKGIFAKHYRLVALSLVVVFIYGSMIWYIFPIKEDISWEGHLAGFATGLLLALAIKVKLPLERKYEWEREDYSEDNDPFLKHFDENGNFIENREEEGEDIMEVRYHYRPDKKE